MPAWRIGATWAASRSLLGPPGVVQGDRVGRIVGQDGLGEPGPFRHISCSSKLSFNRTRSASGGPGRFRLRRLSPVEMQEPGPASAAWSDVPARGDFRARSGGLAGLGGEEGDPPRQHGDPGRAPRPRRGFFSLRTAGLWSPFSYRRRPSASSICSAFSRLAARARQV